MERGDSMIAGRSWLEPVRVDADADQGAWLEARLEGIGGTDAAAVVGEHPTRSAIDVWNERTLGVVPTLDSERGDAGRLLEPVVLGWYERGAPDWPRDGAPLRVVKPPTVYHRDRPWQRGSADGLVFLPEAVAHLGEGADLIAAAPASALDHLAEVKTHGWFAWQSYGGRSRRGFAVLDDDGSPIDVPPDKRVQCAWYMALYEVRYVRLLALVDTHLRRTFVIERDREIEDSLLEEVERFWRCHVLTGEPPPPDGSESYRRFLAGRFKSHCAELVETNSFIDGAIEEHIALKQEAKRIEKRCEHVEQIIKAHIGDAEGVATEIGPVTWRAQPSGKLDESAARTELYAVAGWTDDEIAAFEAKHAKPEHRVLRTPRKRR